MTGTPGGRRIAAHILSAAACRATSRKEDIRGMHVRGTSRGERRSASHGNASVLGVCRRDVCLARCVSGAVCVCWGAFRAWCVSGMACRMPATARARCDVRLSGVMPCRVYGAARPRQPLCVRLAPSAAQSRAHRRPPQLRRRRRRRVHPVPTAAPLLPPTGQARTDRSQRVPAVREPTTAHARHPTRTQYAHPPQRRTLRATWRVSPPLQPPTTSCRSGRRTTRARRAAGTPQRQRQRRALHRQRPTDRLTYTPRVRVCGVCLSRVCLWVCL